MCSCPDTDIDSKDQSYCQTLVEKWRAIGKLNSLKQKKNRSLRSTQMPETFKMKEETLCGVSSK